MKNAKKILLIIAMVMLVMTTSMNVALGEPTPTATPAATPPPTESGTPGTTESGTVETDTAEPTFTLLELNGVGENVVRLQMRLRDLGYFNYRATGMYYGMTQKGVKQYQEQNGLSADGQAGQITYDDLFTIDAVRKPLSASVIPAVGPGFLLTTPVYGELSSWEEINAIFTDGMTVTITDFNTGYAFDMIRTGGENHANVESATSDSYDKFISCFGDDSNWGEKRSVLVSISGVQYAASLYAHAGGEDTVADNKMAGHTELYFNGSTSDILGFVDRYHQEQVLKAAGQLQ